MPVCNEMGSAASATLFSQVFRGVLSFSEVVRHAGKPSTPAAGWRFPGLQKMGHPLHLMAAEQVVEHGSCAHPFLHG